MKRQVVKKITWSFKKLRKQLKILNANPDSILHKDIVNVRPNEKNKCVSGSRSEILGREGRHFIFIFWGKKIVLCILKGILPFKSIKLYFLPENLKKFKVSPVNLGRVVIVVFPDHTHYFWVTLNTGIFYSVSPNPKKGHGKVSRKRSLSARDNRLRGHFLTCSDRLRGHFLRAATG